MLKNGTRRDLHKKQTSIHGLKVATQSAIIGAKDTRFVVD